MIRTARLLQDYELKKNAVIIVAAGRGERLGSEEGPKQYRMLGNKTLLQRTIDCFFAHPDIHIIQVVIHSDDYDLFESATTKNSKLKKPVTGGATRQASCKAGIDALIDQNIGKILIHDAARPFASARLISNVVDGIKQGFCALPTLQIADTVKRVDQDGNVAETVPRESLRVAQTPQGFMFDEIVAAHVKAASANKWDFTDDAAVTEWAGMDIRLVEGDRNNFKITTIEDMAAAQERVAMLNQIPDVRTGSGYDVHTLGAGDHVTLCGIRIPHNQSLQGHSDADVGFHSLTDALLGTIGAGDIGSHFPPTDQKWKGAASDQFLAHAVKLVSEAGGVINNLDVTIICEAPKIGPHRENMRKRLAEVCDLDLSRVSVKATTNEKIGFIGREEGIAAIATATVSFGVTDSV